MAVKILAVGVVAAASLLPYWTHIVSLPDAAAALRTGFDPMYVLINFDNAAGFPMEQYTRVWEFFALLVVAYGFALLFARTRKPGGFAGNSTAEEAPLFGRTTLMMALVAVAGFFWFAASPATRWCFFPLMAVVIAWCDFRAERRSPTGAKLVPIVTTVAVETGAPSRNDMALFAGATLLAAFAGFAGFLWYAALTTEPWYFLPLMALTAAAFELGLPFASRHFRAAIFGFVAVTIVLAIPAAQGDLNWRFTNVDLVAQRLTKEAGPDDFIIVTPWYCGITFDRYYKGPASWDTLPPLKDHSIHRYDLVREKMRDTRAHPARAGSNGGNASGRSSRLGRRPDGYSRPWQADAAGFAAATVEIFQLVGPAIQPELGCSDRHFFEQSQPPVSASLLFDQREREFYRKFAVEHGRRMARLNQPWVSNQCNRQMRHDNADIHLLPGD